MSDPFCMICKAVEDDVDELIGISFDKLDNGDRQNIYLCDECIDCAHDILEHERFKKAVMEVISELEICEE